MKEYIIKITTEEIFTFELSKELLVLEIIRNSDFIKVKIRKAHHRPEECFIKTSLIYYVMEI